MTRNPLWLTTFVGLILIAVAVGSSGLQADSMWHDEQLSLLYAGGLTDTPINPLDTVTRIIERESGQAPFYYMLLSVWGSFVGWTVFAARTFSLLIGVLAIAWSYRLGSDMHSPFAGLCTAVFLGASAFFSAYLHEVRTYSLLVLEILIVLTLYWRLLHHKRSHLMSIVFVLVVTATLYTHPFAIGAVGALGLYHLLLAPRLGTWWRLFILFAVSGILFLPWAVPTVSVIANRVENNTRTLTIRTNAEVIRDMLHAFSNGVWFFLLLLLPSIPLLRTQHSVRLLWLTGISFAGVMLVANQASEMINHVRYLMPLLPAIALLMGIGLASLVTYRKVVIFILLSWSIVGFIGAPTFGNLFYTREEHIVFHITFPFQQIADEIRTKAVADDAIAFYIPYHGWAVRGIVDYYMKDIPARHILTNELGEGRDEPQAKIDGFDMFLGDAGRAWFIVDETVTPNELLTDYESILAERYVLCERTWDTDAVHIDKVAQIQELCNPPDAPIATFGESVALLNFVHQQTDDYDVFYSLWSTHVPADTYSMSLQFSDREGNLVHQVDNPLPIGDFAYRIDRIPHGTLSDDVEITIKGVVYAWQTGQRLRLNEGVDMAELLVIE
jgi:hypothetical protein